jgi:hypothetical protein
MVDQVGATMSFACAVHCVAMPILLAFLPLLGLGFLASRGFEAGMIGFACALALTSLTWGLGLHGRRIILVPFGLAIAFLAVSQFLPFRPHTLAVGLGGALLSLCHLLNRLWCRSLDCCTRDREGLPAEEALR